MKEELGLESNSYLLVSNEHELATIGKNTIVPKPYLVKIEKGTHRLGVVEHYDYVYICLVSGDKPSIFSDISPKWFSLDELEKLKTSNIEHAAWEDVIPIYKKIKDQYNELLTFQNVKL